MEHTVDKFVKYKHNRFTARFSTEYLYSEAHYWFSLQEDGIYRIGLTKFAARMLGELVEFGFEKKAGTKVEKADIIGWLEGFKAASDIYSLVEGEFSGENPDLVEEPELLHARPHDKGWLYKMKISGSEKETLMNVHQYTQFLDKLIDKMTGDE
jgi:glycine cleavage system H protein